MMANPQQAEPRKCPLCERQFTGRFPLYDHVANKHGRHGRKAWNVVDRAFPPENRNG